MKKRHLILISAAITVLASCRSNSIMQEEDAKAATDTLKQLAAAEADFRANDRDNNGVPDFWTGDVAGLHAFGLIPRELAEADTAPLKPMVPAPVPYRGYLFRVLDRDLSASPAEQELREDTDKSGRKVHNFSKFGFVAYPAEKDGGPAFILNEGNTIWRCPTGVVFTDWPAYDNPDGFGITD